MKTIEGFVGESPEGHARIFRLENPRHYVDVPYPGITAAVTGARELVAEVTVEDDADIVEGELDDASFAKFFGAEAAPQAYNSFYCTTGFWQCKHTKLIC